MKKNTQVETTQESQATNKNNTPTGKVKTIKSAEERRKAREEQYRKFRINSLRRRCARMKYTEEQTEEFVKKLIEQMDAPKEYSIIIMLKRNSMKLMEEALENAKIKYTHRSPICEKKESGGYFAFSGDQELLGKLREIAPPDAKIHPYAKKMESVLPKQEKEVIKKPTNNTAEKKVAAKTANKGHMQKSARYMHRLQKGRTKTLADIRRAHKSVKKSLKKGEKVDIKKVLKVAEERKKGGAGTIVQLNTKKSSKGSKKASTNLKKAA